MKLSEATEKICYLFLIISVGWKLVLRKNKWIIKLRHKCLENTALSEKFSFLSYQLHLGNEKEEDIEIFLIVVRPLTAELLIYGWKSATEIGFMEGYCLKLKIAVIIFQADGTLWMKNWTILQGNHLASYILFPVYKDISLTI